MHAPVADAVGLTKEAGDASAAVGATPEATRIASNDAAVADAGLNDQTVSDPCDQRGPSPGEPCTDRDVICLAERNSGLMETACDHGVWRSRKASTAMQSRPKPGACPTLEPVSGSRCVGAQLCTFEGCGGYDPDGNWYASTWGLAFACYHGAWRRYEIYCLGE
jgi:hypothetical protein